MNLTTVLFDLDGTLLPMDMDRFTSGYFKLLVKKLAPLGYEPKRLVDSIWAGTAAMVKNDGKKRNEEAFWETFAQIYGQTRAERDRAAVEEFYNVDFAAAQQFCGYDPAARKCLDFLKAKGLRRILATNPFFPEKATLLRIGWAGLSPEDFEPITTYENISYCKPNPEYYREVLRRGGIAPEEALMVGNDAVEDLAAQKAGIRCFLLTPCLLYEEGLDLTNVPKGGFPELLEYIEKETRRLS